jgi:DNA-binding transcriptional ArsR family regulator
MKKTFSKAAALYDATRTINSDTGKEIIDKLRPGGTKTVQELTNHQPQKDFHLAKLRRHKIVEFKQEGTTKNYSLNLDRYLKILKSETLSADLWLISKSKHRRKLVEGLMQNETYRPEYQTVLSAEMGRLVKAGLAEKIIDPEDLRRATWRRTEKLEIVLAFIEAA